MPKYGSGDGFFTTSNSPSTGAPGSSGSAGTELGASENVFGTNVGNSTGAPGSQAGQSYADSVSVDHTVDPYGSDPFTTTTTTGGTAPSYEPLAGTYPTDTGAGEGALSTDHYSGGLIGAIAKSRGQRAVTDLSPKGDPIQNLLGSESSQSGTSNGVPSNSDGTETHEAS